MIRGKYLRERKAIRTKRRIRLLLIIAIVIILYKILFDSFSLYESEANSDADADVAYFVLNDEYERKVITLGDLEPGESQTAVFHISNYKLDDDNNEQVAETDMEYTLKIRTTTNLPLEYTLTKSHEGNSSQSVGLITDDDGTYFRKLLEETDTFSCDQGYTNTYTLTVTLPSSCDDIKYQNIIEAIEISVEAKQIID